MKTIMCAFYNAFILYKSSRPTSQKQVNFTDYVNYMVLHYKSKQESFKRKTERVGLIPMYKQSTNLILYVIFDWKRSQSLKIARKVY